MKITRFSILTVIFMAFTLVPNSFAQILSQKHLPKGAMARLGKGLAKDVKYSPDGNLIAVGSKIGIWIYDAQTYQEIDLLTEHSESVESVAFSPDGQTLAGANRGGTVKLWDVDTGHLKATFKGSGKWLWSVAFSPDGKTLACADGDELKLWDVATQRLETILKGHTSLVTSVVFSPDGQTLASSSWDKTVRLWNVDTGRLKHTLTSHINDVASVAYSPDGRTLASGGDGTVSLWDAHTGRLKTTIPGRSSGVAFSPDGQTLASMGWGGITLLDADSGQQKAILRGIYDFGGGIAFSPDGQTLAGVNYSMVKLWDVNTEQHKTDLTGHAGISPNIAFSPDGQTLASTDHERVRLWDANTGQHKTDLIGHAGAISYTHNHSSIAFSPDGQMLAGLNGNTVVLSDVNTGQQKMKLMGHTDTIQSVAFSRDGQTLATGNFAEVRLWNVNTGQQKMILQDPDLNGSLIAYAPDGRTLATRGPDDPTIRLWNTVTGEPLKVLIGHTRVPRSFAFSSDGGTFVSGSWGELLLWDVVSGQQKYAFQVDGRCNASGLALSPDGSILVTEWNGTDVMLWNVGTREQLMAFPGHGDQHQHQITSLVFNPNGNMVASAAVDGTVLLWNIASAEPPRLAADVNGDGNVNIQDMILIASNFGATGANAADINGDGVVNIADLVLVAGALGNAAAAPSAWYRDRAVAPTRADVEVWLSEARQLNLMDATSQRGIRFLEALLLAVTPQETGLLANYPNPFNPETWIPYQLSSASDVTLHIYAVDGSLVRTLSLGHKTVGTYQNRSRAAYWDGKNEFGESVASGVYFYTLTAGDFTTTRKMLIRK